MTGWAVCADVGSTYTKVAVVDLDDGTLVRTASHPTTAGTDVLEGLDAAVHAAGGDGHPLYVCSSAGGGLRLAVVGYEALVTAKAAHQVGLSAVRCGRPETRRCVGKITSPGSLMLTSIMSTKFGAASASLISPACLRSSRYFNAVS